MRRIETISVIEPHGCTAGAIRRRWRYAVEELRSSGRDGSGEMTRMMNAACNGIGWAFAHQRLSTQVSR